MVYVGTYFDKEGLGFLTQACRNSLNIFIQNIFLEYLIKDLTRFLIRTLKKKNTFSWFI